MDADDISNSKRFMYQINFLDNNPVVGLVGSHFSRIDSKGHEFETAKTLESNLKIKEGLMTANCFCHGSVMFRKSCLATVGYYRPEFRYTQDYDLWLRISEYYDVANINKVLYKSRRTSNRISKHNLSKQLNYHLLAIQLAKERRHSEKDSLNKIQLHDLQSELINKYKISLQEISKFKSNSFIRYSFESFDAKEYSDALKLWLKGFFFNPKIWKINILMKKLCGVCK